MNIMVLKRIRIKSGPPSKLPFISGQGYKWRSRDGSGIIIRIPNKKVIGIYEDQGRRIEKSSDNTHNVFEGWTKNQNTIHTLYLKNKKNTQAIHTMYLKYRKNSYMLIKKRLPTDTEQRSQSRNNLNWKISRSRWHCWIIIFRAGHNFDGSAISGLLCIYVKPRLPIYRSRSQN